MDEPDTSTSSSEVTTFNRISLNGLTLDRTLLASVIQGSLQSAPTRVPALFATPEGREQLDYLVGCALGSGQNFDVKVAGVSYTFKGSVGLSPSWETGALKVSDRNWISACMLARTNYFHVSVPISVRGTRLVTTSSERAAYTLVEGAFWGDIFTPGAAIKACAGPYKLAGSTLSTLPQRECTTAPDGVTTKCGFTYAGACAAICTETTAGYQNCGGISETITSYVAKPN